jgi:orotidine-5'-phosphate decarboxylase
LNPSPGIIPALDVDELDRAVSLAEELAPQASYFKVGSRLFTRHGPICIRRITDTKIPVFLDMKFHDIPSTVAGALAAAADLGVRLATVHALGGPRMIEAAVAAAGPCHVIAVTVLTSHDDPELAALGVQGPCAEAVRRLARLAVGAGARGVVCSPHEVAALRRELGPLPMLVVPGVRPAAGATGDQRRVSTPAEAWRAGASHLVIGRPIIEHHDPRAALREIVAEVGGR